MPRRTYVSFERPAFLKTEADKLTAQPFFDEGAEAYADFGFNLTGRPFCYLARPKFLPDLTVRLLQALDRCGGGFPSRDHKEARLADVHNGILATITKRHSYQRRGQPPIKRTLSRATWTLSTPEGEPMVWALDSDVHRREGGAPGWVIGRRGWLYAGYAKEVLDQPRNPDRESSLFYDDCVVFQAYTTRPLLPGMPPDPDDIIYEGPLVLQKPKICFAYRALFLPESLAEQNRLTDGIQAYKRSRTILERYAREARDWRHVLPSEAGDLVAMNDLATATGRDCAEWEDEITQQALDDMAA